MQNSLPHPSLGTKNVWVRQRGWGWGQVQLKQKYESWKAPPPISDIKKQCPGHSFSVILIQTRKYRLPWYEKFYGFSHFFVVEVETRLDILHEDTAEEWAGDISDWRLQLPPLELVKAQRVHLNKTKKEDNAPLISKKLYIYILISTVTLMCFSETRPKHDFGQVGSFKTSDQKVLLRASKPTSLLLAAAVRKYFWLYSGVAVLITTVKVHVNDSFFTQVGILHFVQAHLPLKPVFRSWTPHTLLSGNSCCLIM